MAALARGRGIPVEVATFETWDDAGRQFDLLTSGASWHWIDPALGIAGRAARVLRQGGTLARFWSYEVPDEQAASAFASIYASLAPKATQYVPLPPTDWEDSPALREAFSSIENRIYEWRRTLSTEEWVGMVTTFSDHQRLGRERLTTLQHALTSAWR